MILGKILSWCLIFLATFSAITSSLAAQTRTPTPSNVLVVGLEGGMDTPDKRAVQIVDPLTRKVVATVPMGDVPHEVAVSDDGKLAFVTTCKCGKGFNPDTGAELKIRAKAPPNNDYISVIDLVAQKELRRVYTGLYSRPHGIGYASGKVYYTVEEYSAIARYDPASNQIDWIQGTGQGGTHLLVVTKDAKKIFTANVASNSVSAITGWDDPTAHMPTSWKVTTIPVGDSPHGIDMSPDEKEVWVTTKRDRGVSIIDTTTLKVETVSNVAEVPLRLQFTPDGKRVFIEEEFSGVIAVLDVATRKVIKRITLVKPEGDFKIHNEEASYVTNKQGVAIIANSYLRNIAMAHDGSRAYVGLFGVNRLGVIDLKTLEVVDSIAVGSLPNGLGWAMRK